jgi:hypothetical protein
MVPVNSEQALKLLMNVIDPDADKNESKEPSSELLGITAHVCSEIGFKWFLFLFCLFVPNIGLFEDRSIEPVFLENSGDHARIRSIHNFISEENREAVVCYCLGSKSKVHKQNGSIYVERPRRLGEFLRKLLAFAKNDSLNENLALLTQIIFDEPFLVMQTLEFAQQADAVWVHGDMSVVPLTLRLLGFRKRIVLDSLANYPQTLYTRLRNASLFKRALAYTRLGIYLVNYRAQLRASDRVLYPSSFDANNSKKMYALEDKIEVVPNMPAQFWAIPSELNWLRQECREKLGIKKNSAVLLFCGGLRSKANKDALELLVGLTPNQLSSKREITLLVTTLARLSQES